MKILVAVAHVEVDKLVVTETVDGADSYADYRSADSSIERQSADTFSGYFDLKNSIVNDNPHGFYDRNKFDFFR